MNLIDAVVKNDTRAVSKLLANGIDPNIIEDEANVTPLHYAAQNNSLEAALKLIIAGARVNAVTEDGYIPLDIAVLNGSKHIIKPLSDC